MANVTGRGCGGLPSVCVCEYVCVRARSQPGHWIGQERCVFCVASAPNEMADGTKLCGCHFRQQHAATQRCLMYPYKALYVTTGAALRARMTAG